MCFVKESYYELRKELKSIGFFMNSHDIFKSPRSCYK